ncbi:MAG: lipoyl(octanoyl) transferase LipB [Proteobacteria bacterium]|nr:lipoyl(octanoyl) transferase LipB [Pseudomonadota bacterium]
MIMKKSNSASVEWKVSTEPVTYQVALQEMESRVDAIAKEGLAECVWLLEHPPLYTGGTSARPEDLLEKRFPVFETGRGGEYTYHGPGQRVAYVMLNLKNRQSEPDIKKYVWQLEEMIIRALALLGVKGERRAGRVGIWVVTSDTEKKIAAIGVRVRHWVTYHGIAINNTPDLTHFDGIVPCGVHEYGVTSLKDQGLNISMSQLDAALASAFEAVFGN